MTVTLADMLGLAFSAGFGVLLMLCNICSEELDKGWFVSWVVTGILWLCFGCGGLKCDIFDFAASKVVVISCHSGTAGLFSSVSSLLAYVLSSSLIVTGTFEFKIALFATLPSSSILCLMVFTHKGQ